MRADKIQIRDPFVLPVAVTGTYYLFGTTDKDCWNGPGIGFDCYLSRDLEDWRGPVAALRPRPGFWATTHFWAPEVHAYRGRFFMFATFNVEGGFRGTQILVADRPEGPYEPWSDRPVTPPHWQCLDGTLHVDAEGAPWIVFCHEWLQVHDGAMYALRLSPDLRGAMGRPVFLFNASEAPWAHRVHGPHVKPAEGQLVYQFPTYVTDGPFLYRTGTDALLMLWSSSGARGYAMGLARSTSGSVQGPWEQEGEPLWAEDGGHGMIFRAFDGRLFLALHVPNVTPNERAIFQEVVEEGDGLRLKPGQAA